MQSGERGGNIRVAREVAGHERTAATRPQCCQARKASFKLACLEETVWTVFLSIRFILLLYLVLKVFPLPVKTCRRLLFQPPILRVGGLWT